MQTLEAPARLTRREMVAQLLASLPPEPIDDLRICFAGEQFPTTSFMDELVRQTIAEGRIHRLTLVNAQEFTVELARDAAERYGVLDRLAVVEHADSG